MDFEFPAPGKDEFFDIPKSHAVRFGKEIAAHIDRMGVRYICDTGRTAHIECDIRAEGSEYWVRDDPRYRVQVRTTCAGIGVQELHP